MVRLISFRFASSFVIVKALVACMGSGIGSSFEASSRKGSRNAFSSSSFAADKLAVAFTLSIVIASFAIVP